MKNPLKLTILPLLLSLTGCSLFGPSHQTLSVQCSEPHAKVWIDGGYEGEAPVHASVIRNHTHGILVKKEGFQTSNRIVDYKMSTTGVLDLIGGCLFLVPAIGFTSPAAFSLDDSTIIINLAAEPASVQAQGPK